MISIWILASIFLSFYIRITNNQSVIPATLEKSIGKRTLREGSYFYIKLLMSLAIGSFLVKDFIYYHQWWNDYTSQHSLFFFWVFNLAVLTILFLMKEASYEREMWPGTYQGLKDGIYRRDMKTTLIENSIFYGFLLFSPTLPFRDIIVLRNYI